MKFKAVARTLLLMALLAFPALGSAQETTWVAQTNRGWIGFRVDYTISSVGGTERTVATIESVEKESPAERAGILPGDIITHLDGRQVSPRVFDNLSQTLKPGDLLPITLRRGGRVREITVEADTWPEMERVLFTPEFGEMVIRLDTVQRVILEELDQMRLRIGELNLDSAPGRMTFSIVRRPPAEAEGEVTITYHQMFEPSSDSLAFYARDFFFAPESPMPFEALVVQSEAIRRVRDDQMRVGDALNEVRRLEGLRRNELRSASAEVTEEAVRQDERVRELKAKEAGLLQEQEVLFQQLKQVSEKEMERRAVELQARQEGAWARAWSVQDESRQQHEEGLRTQEAEEARYTYSRLMAAGLGLVAGAQLEPMNPKLAQYFHVDGGVLVLDVLEGTPAAEAELQGGDVIITVAGDSVSSVEELKFGLTYLGRPLRLRVIRNGEPVEITIRR